MKLEQLLASLGEYFLEKAVINVLLKAERKGERLGPADISKRAGIFRESGYAMKAGNDYIVWGILGKLVKNGWVKKCEPEGGKTSSWWELTNLQFCQSIPGKGSDSDCDPQR